jgi:hypothetical protein
VPRVPDGERDQFAPLLGDRIRLGAVGAERLRQGCLLLVSDVTERVGHVGGLQQVECRLRWCHLLGVRGAA